MAYNAADFNIPLNVITKIIAETVTDNISVQEDYVKALSRATSLFILYSTTKANEIASGKNRRTIHSQDVLDSISHLGFEHLVPELETWLAHFNDEKEKESAQKPKRGKNRGNEESEPKPAQEEDSQNSATSE